METPKEYYYTYYSYEEWGRGYFGSRGCKCLPEEDVKYLGSSKDKTFKPTQKIILKDDYATREEAYADEIILQKYYKVVENPHFANRSYQTSTKFYYINSTKQAIENGKKGGRKTKELGVGVHSLTKEQKTQAGKKGAQKQKELGIGLYGLTKDERIQNGKKSGQKAYELGIGIHSLTKEQRSELGKKNYELGIGINSLTKEQRSELGKKNYELGINSLTPEERSEINKKAGQKTYELGIGVHRLTKKQKSEIAKKNNAQKWECVETGYVSNAGGLSRYQKSKGIDTSKRRRIS